MHLTKYLLILVSFWTYNFTAFGQYASSSVLNTNDIYKLSVENTGIYKLDHSFLSSMADFDVNSIDPRKIHIYTQSGGLVPQSRQDQRIDDLKEVAIYIKGEEDGSFDPDDYILLYMEGADRFMVKDQVIDFEKNVFSEKNFFFLKIEDTNGSRIQISDQVTAVEYSDYTESIKHHEVDRLNLLGNYSGTQGSGKNWYGESFTHDLEQDFISSFDFDNFIPGSRIELDVRMVARSSQATSFDIEIDDTIFSRAISSTNTGNVEAVYARIGFIRESFTLDSDLSKVLIRFNPANNTSEAWLDHIQLIVQESLAYNEDPIYLFRRDSRYEEDFGYTISSTKDLKLWNISDPHEISQMTTENIGDAIQFGFETESEVKLFIAFDENGKLGTANFEGKIENQNLHGIERADLAIVYHKNFEAAAQTLEEHRRLHSGLEVVTVDIDKIYNEFGGGKEDPTALRDFAKMLYDRDPHFQYLLLLGDASYDYRGLVNGLEDQNFVPTYETDESLNPIEAFPSDDFFALLSDNEGDDSLNGALDIGVGRLPCKTLEEANAVVNKIIHYDLSPDCLGDWKMRIGFAGDDEDNNTHVRQADGISDIVAQNHPELVQQKVYFDAFNQVSTPGGERYPDAKDALIKNINNGQLALCYLGHGGPKGWAQERVFQVGDIINLKNLDKLPVLVTATCSLTGFDEPSVVSAGEEAILNPSGGAIALFSTVRAVYSSQNERITREVYRKIFTRDTGERKRLGDIIRDSQNSNSSDTISSNTRKFMLFGDPSQTLAMAMHTISIDTFNDEPVDDTKIDTISALERTRISGSIKNFSDQIQSDFNGTLSFTVYDKISELKTLDNDDTGRIFEFDSRKNILFKGSAIVENGEFEIEFILPKDINFEYGEGFISFYASNGIDRDAGGYYDQIIIGGTGDGTIVDNEGPEIKLYLNDRSFVNGGSVGSKALLIADLSDENGINLSSTSIGHDITAILDNELTDPIILNEFYTPSIDFFGSGTVLFEFSELEIGDHSIRVKAWDILNNSSEATLDFVVAESEEGFIENLFNYPNPFYESTTFKFDHDLINTNLDVELDVYSLSGKLVKTYTANVFSSGSMVELDVDFNNFNSATDLHKGLYVYKIKIHSEELNLSRESNFEKLLILN